MKTSYQALARRQLSKSLAEGPQRARPSNGWIKSVRQALDMTVRQLAERLGVEPSSVVRLEQRESDDTISLAALRRAADALNCELVYAIVPRVPASAPADQLLDALIDARAHEVAAADVGRLIRTMALEDQAADDADVKAQIAERVAALKERPRRLWDRSQPDKAETAIRRRKQRQ